MPIFSEVFGTCEDEDDFIEEIDEETAAWLADAALTNDIYT